MKWSRNTVKKCVMKVTVHTPRRHEEADGVDSMV